MASLVYNRHRYRVLAGEFEIASAVIRVLFTTTGYTPNADHNTLSDVTNELTTSGYSRQTLTNQQVIEDDASDQAILDANDPTFSGVGNGTQTAAWLIAFERLGGADAGTDPLICALDIPNTLTVGDTIVVQFGSQGLVAAT